MDERLMTATLEVDLNVAAAGATVEITDLWHADCGDGLLGELSLTPGTYASSGATLVVDSTGATLTPLQQGTTTLEFPVTLAVSGVSALGCEDHVEGETVATMLTLTIDVVDGPWDFGESCASGLLLEGAEVTLIATRAGSQAGTRPDIVLQGDGVRIRAHERLVTTFQFEGVGTVSASIDGQLVRTFEVVEPASITALDVSAASEDGAVQASTDGLIPDVDLFLRADAVRTGEVELCGVPPADDFIVASTTPGLCTVDTAVCPALTSWALDDYVVPAAPGDCVVEVTHTPSNTTTTVSARYVF